MASDDEAAAKAGRAVIRAEIGEPPDHVWECGCDECRDWDIRWAKAEGRREGQASERARVVAWLSSSAPPMASWLAAEAVRRGDHEDDQVRADSVLIVRAVNHHDALVAMVGRLLQYVPDGSAADRDARALLAEVKP